MKKLIILLMLSGFSSYAQPDLPKPGSGYGNGNRHNGHCHGAPIDGAVWIGVLIGAGIGFGSMKLKGEGEKKNDI